LISIEISTFPKPILANKLILCRISKIGNEMDVSELPRPPTSYSIRTTNNGWTKKRVSEVWWRRVSDPKRLHPKPDSREDLLSPALHREFLHPHRLPGPHRRG